jgi:regulator of replication initiation timing
MIMNTREYIQMLGMRVLEIKTENGTLKTENGRLRRENEALKNRLRFYENPNTPPSQPTLKKQKERDEKVEKKRGAPPGHRGATRKRTR